MSRLGKIPVIVPAGVQVKLDGQKIEAKGVKGVEKHLLPAELKAELKDGKLIISIAHETGTVKAQWGLHRMLVENIIIGVGQGYRKELEITGVGYKAELKGKDLLVSAGFSSPKLFKAVAGITFAVENQTKIIIDGINKHMVGQVASEIRKLRKPEPYKGKGIKYVGEKIRRKAGKVAGK